MASVSKAPLVWIDCEVGIHVSIMMRPVLNPTDDWIGYQQGYHHVSRRFRD